MAGACRMNVGLVVMTSGMDARGRCIVVDLCESGHFDSISSLIQWINAVSDLSRSLRKDVGETIPFISCSETVFCV